MTTMWFGDTQRSGNGRKFKEQKSRKKSAAGYTCHNILAHDGKSLSELKPIFVYYFESGKLLGATELKLNSKKWDTP